MGHVFLAGVEKEVQTTRILGPALLDVTDSDLE
jgi:hypothetical protein